MLNVLSALLVLSPLSVVVGFELGLIHVNDIHVRFEETDTYSGTCKPGKECFGGIARLSQTVKDLRAKDPNSIFVNGGDFYQGTSWYTLFKWKVVAPFANKLNFDASSPGNHEFDDGVDGFVPFLKNITFPVICANIDVSNQTNMEGLFNKSIVIERGGRKIGLIGFLTPETRELSSPGEIKFLDEVGAVLTSLPYHPWVKRRQCQRRPLGLLADLKRWCSISTMWADQMRCGS